MAMPRKAINKKRSVAAGCIAVVLAYGITAPQAVKADFQGTGLTETVETLSGATTATAVASNLAVLQAKLVEINAQIASASSTEAAQLRAVATALQGIIARLQQGYTVESYTATTDEATLETTVTIGFTDASGNKSSLVVVVPPEDGYDSTGSDTEEDEESEDESSSSSNSDILTQIMQQLASSMGSGSNPLQAIQSTLSGLTAPAQALTGALTDAATTGAAAAALKCSPDGKKLSTANGVAVYDSSTGNLYMPDGSVLKAHSGRGSFMDDPSASNKRGLGPLPTNVYNLSMRESPFHGVQALRLNPAGGGAMYGRDGFLVHPPLRRDGPGSSGCIAITTDYAKFLQAYKNGQVKQVVVVSSVAEANQKCEQPVYDTPDPEL